MHFDSDLRLLCGGWEQSRKMVLHDTGVIEPHAVHLPDRCEEIENRAIPDEAGPSGGVLSSGGTVAAGEYINAVWFQF